MFRSQKFINNFIFSNNYQCNYTKTIGRLRRREYRRIVTSTSNSSWWLFADIHVAFGLRRLKQKPSYSNNNNNIQREHQTCRLMELEQMHKSLTSVSEKKKLFEVDPEREKLATDWKLFYGLAFNNSLSVFQLQYFLPINKIKASCRGPTHSSKFKIIEMCNNLIFKTKQKPTTSTVLTTLQFSAASN